MKSRSLGNWISEILAWPARLDGETVDSISHSNILGQLATGRWADALVNIGVSLAYPFVRARVKLDPQEVASYENLGRRMGFSNVVVAPTPVWRPLVDASVDCSTPGSVVFHVNPLLPHWSRLNRFRHEFNHIVYRQQGVAASTPLTGWKSLPGIRRLVATYREERWVSRQADLQMNEAAQALGTLSQEGLQAMAEAPVEGSLQTVMTHWMARIAQQAGLRPAEIRELNFQRQSLFLKEA